MNPGYRPDDAARQNARRRGLSARVTAMLGRATRSDQSLQKVWLHWQFAMTFTGSREGRGCRDYVLGTHGSARAGMNGYCLLSSAAVSNRGNNVRCRTVVVVRYRKCGQRRPSPGKSCTSATQVARPKLLWRVWIWASATRATGNN